MPSLGMARVYEMQNELEKARDEYREGEGRLRRVMPSSRPSGSAKPEAKETYAWLATADAAATPAPMGPGTPGQRPEFSAGDLPLPGETPATAAPASGAAVPAASVRRLAARAWIRVWQPTDGADRYDDGSKRRRRDRDQPADAGLQQRVRRQPMPNSRQRRPRRNRPRQRRPPAARVGEAHRLRCNTP